MILDANSAQLVDAFIRGQVLAYPTEAVFGLGCDPLNEKAVMQILNLKNRPLEKGVILIASNMSQLLPFADFSQLDDKIRGMVDKSWPGPNTWLIPKLPSTPDFLTGGSELIAVRVSAHPVVKTLCENVKSALVSTSANLSGEEPARTQSEIIDQFGDQVVCVEGEVGQQANPSQIRHGITGEIIRAS